MKIGVAGYLPSDWRKIDVAATRRVVEAGFSGGQVFIDRPLEANPLDVARVKKAFDDGGLIVAQTNGWYESLINPDDVTRAEGVSGMQALIHIGRQLDTRFVYVRPGSINQRGHWWPHPDNHLQRTFDCLVTSMKQLSQTAQDEGVILGIEGHVVSTLNTAQRVRDLLDAVGSPALKHNLDPVNFVGTVEDVWDTTQVLNQLFDLLGHDLIAAHAKDCTILDEHVVHIVEVVPCNGTLNYEVLMRRWEESCPEGYFLIEHLSDERVDLARKAIGDKARQLGIRLE